VWLLVPHVTTPSIASARGDGMIGLSGKTGGTFCRNCHGGGVTPAVDFSGPTVVAPGATATFAFTVRSNAPAQQMFAGMNVAASDGMLSAPSGQGLHVELGEVTHSVPKANDVNGEATFEIRWQAPVEPGVYTLFGAGVSANGDEKRTGDAAERTTLDISVGVTPCVGDCNDDGEVTLDEVLTVMNIALGDTAVAACPVVDQSGDGEVTVDEILLAVNRAATGCSAP